ncbi:MAG: AAA domain-containing protein, partial [Lentisphaerota bacterium]
MPVPETAAIVNAAAASAEKYLAFLINNEAGVARYPATHICLAGDADRLLENVIWNTYYGELPPHETIRSDTSATLLCHAAPGKEMEIRILEYDRRTGQIEFAARALVPGETGDIVVDFRWLVRRYLDWLQQRGRSICHINEIQCPDRDRASRFVAASVLSSEQLEAIKTMLTTPLSYIWGPPGAGKTKLVLAKAVRHLVECKQKVLVLASTNLAVDNALTAILEEGVIPKEVARIGVPSPGFVKQYPDCCEQQAFQIEIRQIESQIKTLESNIASVQKQQQLDKQIKQDKIELVNNRHELDERRADHAAVQQDMRGNQATISKLIIELHNPETQLKAKRDRVKALAWSRLLSEIEALEGEQARTIDEIAELTKTHRALWFCFFIKKQKLAGLISTQKAHLRTVETTLDNKREKRAELVPVVLQLEAELAALEFTCQCTYNKIADLQHQLAKSENQEQVL